MEPVHEAGQLAFAASPGERRWAVERASAVVDVAPGEGTWATLTGWATLTVEGSGWIGLEVPEARVQALDGGCSGWVPRWTVHEVAVDGAPVAHHTTPLDRATRVPWRPGRRLVLAELAEEAGEHTVRVHWSQRVPWTRMEQLASTTTGFGKATPLLSVFPTVAGAETAVDWELVARSPPGMDLVVSGVDARTMEQGIRVVRASGHRLDVASVVGGVFARPAGDRVRGWSTERGAESWLAAIDGPLRQWSGVGLAPSLDLVEVAGSWLPTRSLWAEGLVVLRPQATLCDGSSGEDVDQAKMLQRTDVIAVIEGAALASWVGSVDTPGDGSAWLAGLARAFALDLVAADAPAVGKDWREALAACAGEPGPQAALAPSLSATTGFRQAGAHCAAPLILGPMLDDRLGRERAAAVRRSVLQSGRVDTGSLSAAVLAADPEAGPWVARWLLDGRPVDPTLTHEVAVGTHGSVVRGTLGADLGGAPVWLMAHGRGARERVMLRPTGPEGAFSVELPFAVTRVAVDPDHRLLRATALDPMPAVPNALPE